MLLIPPSASYRPSPPPVEPRSRGSLHRAHFAFMRAVLEGLDPTRSWERYLAVADARVDQRLVRATLQWIRDEFAAAALRERRPGTARLVLMDVQRLFQGEGLVPSLAAFAEAAGLEDCSQAEQTEAYQARYSDQIGHQRRRQRLLRRQLEALRWLETLVSEPPSKCDPLRAWLPPQLSVRLEAASLATLGELVAHIQGHGNHWTRAMPGLGRTKARRVVDWLRFHEVALGSPLNAHVDLAPSAWSPELKQGIQPLGFDVRPLEKLTLPAALLGREGSNRADPSLKRLTANDDLTAIHAWLAQAGPSPNGPRYQGDAAYVAGGGDSPRLTHTQRAYRKEAERLLLWSTLVRAKALSSLEPQDAQAYWDFLADPVPRERWCSARVHGRWSPLWRPFAGPLSSTSRAHTQRVLCSLFSFLVKQGYLREAVFTRTQAFLTTPTQNTAASRSTLKSSTPSAAQVVGGDEDTDTQLRLRLVLRLLEISGLRLSQLCEQRLCDWQAEPSEAGAWCLKHTPGASRQTPLQPVRLTPNELKLLLRYLGARGLPAHLGVPCHPDIHLIGASPRAPKLRNQPRHAPGDGIQPGTLRDQIGAWLKSKQASPPSH